MRDKVEGRFERPEAAPRRRIGGMAPMREAMSRGCHAVWETGDQLGVEFERPKKSGVAA
jgi:hypothetical protein